MRGAHSVSAGGTFGCATVDRAQVAPPTRHFTSRRTTPRVRHVHVMDVFRKGIAAADGVIRRTGQNLMDDQAPGPAAGAFRGRATPGGRGQAGSPGMSTPQRTAGASSLMDADVIFHTPSTSAPAASGGSMDLSALAEMLRIDITARCDVACVLG
jgi:hypothetical protein